MANGAKKRWLVVLPTHQYEWIHETSTETETTGSVIISEIIERAMTENPAKFKATLAQAKLREKLQALNDRKAALLEEEKELTRSIREKEKVLA